MVTTILYKVYIKHLGLMNHIFYVCFPSNPLAFVPIKWLPLVNSWSLWNYTLADIFNHFNRSISITISLSIASKGQLTHWGRMTHLTIIGPVNGLSPGRRQAIIWTWDIVNWTLRNKLQWNFKQNSNIFIQENGFECVVCEMASIWSRPQCVNNEPVIALTSIGDKLSSEPMMDFNDAYTCASRPLWIYIVDWLFMFGSRPLKESVDSDFSEKNSWNMNPIQLFYKLKQHKNCRPQIAAILTLLLHFELSRLTIHKLNNTYKLWPIKRVGDE